MNRSRLLSLSLLAALAGALLAAPLAGADLLTPEDGGSPNADAIDELYKYILVVATVVFLGVESVLIYSLFKFKARKGAVAAQIRGNTRLEIGWTVGAALVLVVLAVLTFVKLDEIRNPPNSGPEGLQVADGVLLAQRDMPKPPNGKALNIEVNGQQYVWRYTYPDGDDNVLNNAFAYEEMVVPTDTTVTLEIRAQDVAHSWWIPKLGGKADAVPPDTKYVNKTWFKITEKGNQRYRNYTGATYFNGVCAELCGDNHADMRNRVVALPVVQYQRWVEDQKRLISESQDALAQQREDRGTRE